MTGTRSPLAQSRESSAHQLPAQSVLAPVGADFRFPPATSAHILRPRSRIRCQGLQLRSLLQAASSRNLPMIASQPAGPDILPRRTSPLEASQLPILAAATPPVANPFALDKASTAPPPPRRYVAAPRSPQSESPETDRNRNSP